MSIFEIVCFPAKGSASNPVCTLPVSIFFPLRCLWTSSEASGRHNDEFRAAEVPTQTLAGTEGVPTLAELLEVPVAAAAETGNPDAPDVRVVSLRTLPMGFLAPPFSVPDPVTHYQPSTSPLVPGWGPSHDQAWASAAV